MERDLSLLRTNLPKGVVAFCQLPEAEGMLQGMI